MNSVNPFRLEGQKAIMFRVLEGLGWEVPDWIVVPGGNLGNSSAFGKAFLELKHLGLIDRVPRLAVINAAGARTLNELVEQSRAALEQRSARERDPRRYFARARRGGREGLDDRLGDRDQPAGQSQEVPAGARCLRRRGARGDRPGDPRRQGPRRVSAAWAASRPARPAWRGSSGSARRASSRPASGSSASSPATSSRTRRPPSPIMAPTRPSSRRSWAAAA